MSRSAEIDCYAHINYNASSARQKYQNEGSASTLGKDVPWINGSDWTLTDRCTVE